MRILFDTSALYKRYSAEAGRAQVMALGEQADEICVAAHGKSEIASALNRQRHDGLIGDADYQRIMAVVTQEFFEFHYQALDSRVEALAIAAMEKSHLGAMDALHIGSAKAAGVDLFVTADKRQALAAEAVGLKTQLVAV
ncbi:MAG: type II toxin-antitoxin system VapC family toxin [Burkholderiaceae bacterium]